jgi:CheY-like chemotaxis protein
VLVVDDNCDAATVLGDLLALNGHDVVLAEDGPSALRAVDNGPAFDVVLLDIGLPVMSGYELAQHLRGRADGDAMRLVALTGYGLASDVEQARSSGFDLHLVKPVEPEILLRAIAAAGRNGDAHPG